jgi:hypothetical protein
MIRLVVAPTLDGTGTSEDRSEGFSPAIWLGESIEIVSDPNQAKSGL